MSALVVGLAILLMVSRPNSHPKPAQAQTSASLAVLNVSGSEIATFGKVDEVTSSIKLPRARVKVAQLEPLRIVLEWNTTSSLVLSQWHQQATMQLTGYRRDATLTFFDETGTATVKIFLQNAWPAEYHLEQQDDQLVERVTLTASVIQRVAP